MPNWMNGNRIIFRLSDKHPDYLVTIAFDEMTRYTKEMSKELYEICLNYLNSISLELSEINNEDFANLENLLLLAPFNSDDLLSPSEIEKDSTSNRLISYFRDRMR